MSSFILHAKRLQCVYVLKWLQYTTAHMVAVSSLLYTCMISGFWGRIPKRDAHIYTLNENSVPIMCLALRRLAITYL